ncbi:hypothetical protein [Cyanobium sp. Morenito 9A2]|uniref:hypothetical protein n=1 Tax=Cyanobium sp. Morenito 9A2 TaxID=2823718 RepID=UPI0020CCDCDE|nr:hypothetical protein [Cyanobium sp. Morenito 9A2]MCP9849605.1 hypothetical protein [Cyanobium sp. Morenito 9A2]
MKRLSGLGLVLAGMIALPAGAGLAFDRTPDLGGQQLIARGGGRGGGGGSRGGGGGGGARMGGGGGGNRGGGGGGVNRGGGGGNRANTGFANAGGGLNRGSGKPSGGWSNRVSSPGANPSINRPAGGANLGNRTPGNRPSGGRDLAGNRDLNRGGGAGTRDIARPGGNRDLAGNRDLNRDGNRNLNRDVNRDLNRNVNRDVNRTINRSTNVNRNWNRNVNLNNVNVRPGWARAGWGVARPWNHGWYGGWNTPTWGWWGARAAAWGVGTLATAAIINSAVNDAISSNQTYIVVPNTNYQLLFGSVQPSGTAGVTFAVTADGSTYELSADCNAGLINGQEPQNAQEAELLNSACQVAFGNA